MQNRNIVRTIACAAALTLFGAGCGASVSQKIGDSVADRVVGAATGGKVEVNSGNDHVTFKDKDGNVLSYGDNLTIPADFPKDVPVYAGAVVKGVTNNSSNGSVGATLNLEIADDATKVASWYDGQLKGAGFTQDSDLDASGTIVRMYSKANVTMSFTITTDSEKANTTWVTVIRAMKN